MDDFFYYAAHLPLLIKLVILAVLFVVTYFGMNYLAYKERKKK